MTNETSADPAMKAAVQRLYRREISAAVLLAVVVDVVVYLFGTWIWSGGSGPAVVAAVVVVILLWNVFARVRRTSRHLRAVRSLLPDAGPDDIGRRISREAVIPEARVPAVRAALEQWSADELRGVLVRLDRESGRYQVRYPQTVKGRIDVSLTQDGDSVEVRVRGRASQLARLDEGKMLEAVLTLVETAAETREIEASDIETREAEAPESEAAVPEKVGSEKVGSEKAESEAPDSVALTAEAADFETPESETPAVDDAAPEAAAASDAEPDPDPEPEPEPASDRESEPDPESESEPQTGRSAGSLV
jgi:hypothetical protein